MNASAYRDNKSANPIDQMDAGLDLLATVEAALYSDDCLDQDMMVAIRGTVGQALKLIRPAREWVNESR